MLHQIANIHPSYKMIHIGNKDIMLIINEFTSLLII
jgi:hypothetical protein